MKKILYYKDIDIEYLRKFEKMKNLVSFKDILNLTS